MPNASVDTVTHPPTVPVFGELEPDPGCSDCETCMDHDGCADSGHPVQDSDCETCGACRACIALCAQMRAADPARTPEDMRRRPTSEERGMSRIMRWTMDGRLIETPDTSRMASPVRCTHCGGVYDLGSVTVTAYYADCSMWKSPCCDRLVDDRGETGWKPRRDYERLHRAGKPE
jgi:hypothetical protein